MVHDRGQVDGPFTTECAGAEGEADGRPDHADGSRGSQARSPRPARHYAEPASNRTRTSPAVCTGHRLSRLEQAIRVRTAPVFCRGFRASTFRVRSAPVVRGRFRASTLTG